MTEVETQTSFIARGVDGTPLSFVPPNRRQESVWSSDQKPLPHVELRFTSIPQMGMSFELTGFGYYQVAEPLSPEYKIRFARDVFLKRLSEDEFRAKDVNSKIDKRFLPIPHSIKEDLGLT